MRIVKIDRRVLRFSWRAAGAAMLMVVGLLQLHGAEAAVFIVNNTLDSPGGSAELCADGNQGTCSLRDAVAAAAAVAGDDIIEINVGDHKTILLPTAPITLGSNVSIRANDSPSLFIDGNATTRLFVVNNGVIADISSLTIYNGVASVGGAAKGGGIVNHGTLALSHVLVNGCHASDQGGGIFNDGTLTLMDSEVAENVAGTQGGGITNYLGSLTLVHSTVHNNHAGLGAGIFSLGTLELNSSSVINNTSSTSAGGIAAGVALTLVNSTVSGNSAPTVGGINSEDADGLFVNTTLAGNTGTNGADYAEAGTGNVVLKNTIVGDCKITSSAPTPVTDGGGNLDGGIGCLGALPAQASSHSNATLNLGPLQDNGGPTLTRLPGAGSDALDGGVDSICNADPIGGVDQRGVLRPQLLHCDVGAVEAVLLPCFVKASAVGANNGTSWTDAYTSLQSALTSLACTEIWVAKGTYKTTSGSNRALTFNVRRMVKLRGGFAGTGASPNGRDFIANETVLSGDIGAAGNASDNAYHVVSIDGTTAAGGVGRETSVDGFTITGGHAADDPSYDSGGGIVCYGSGHDCGPTLENLTVVGNSANYGGGLFNDGTFGTSSPLLRNVRFAGNSAVFDGGAMYSWGRHGIVNPVVLNSTFDGNAAGEFGGAVFLDGSVGTSGAAFNDVVFTNNSAVGEGGAICNWGREAGHAAPSMIGVTFVGNTALDGGAIANDGLGGESSPTLGDVTFAANTATQRGGAMFSDGSAAGISNAVLNGVTFAGNTATDGGAMYNFGHDGQSSPALTNATFSRNTAGHSAGGIFNDAYTGLSRPSLNGVTFHNNSGGQFGGAIVNYSPGGGNASPTLTNVILWEDTALASAEIFNNTAVPVVDHSIVKGSHGSGGGWDAALGTDGGGNLDTDPLLGVLQDNGGPTVTMMPGLSFSLNAGSNASCLATDQRGVLRPQLLVVINGGNCDIGAVERRAFEDNIFNSRFEVF